jgi:NAD(P)-dependent dehydrogenase (short-subunit alcohol dehydrogenase family)
MNDQSKNDSKEVILITGSSTGFGRLMAETLARSGYTVFATMRNLSGKNAEPASDLLELAQREQLSLHVVEIDVKDDDSVAKGVEDVIRQAGSLDVLVNNAGVMYTGITEGYTVEQARNQFEPNFFGVIRMNRAVLPQMRAQKNGLIISVSSLAGGLLFPFFGLYCASKHALEALALAYRYDLAALGIDSVVIEPALFATNLLASNDQPQDQTRLPAYAPLNDEVDRVIGDIENGQLDPQIVVDDIIKLLETPFGRRPFRTISGPDFGLEPVNRLKNNAQQSLLQAMDLAHLELPPVSLV